jgi:hypothetical protein
MLIRIFLIAFCLGLVDGAIALAECELDSHKLDTYDQWLDDFVKDIPARQVQSASFYTEKQHALNECLRKLNRPEFERCTENLKVYLDEAVIATRESSDHKLKLTVSDQDYFKVAAPYIGDGAIPGPMRSPEFLAAIQTIRYDDPKTFEPILKQLGLANHGLPPNQKWRFLAFEPSRLVDTTDELGFEANRGMIHIPNAYFIAHPVGGNPSSNAPSSPPSPQSLFGPAAFSSSSVAPPATVQNSFSNMYIQFSIHPTSKAKKASHQLSVLTVIKKPGVQKKEYYLADHWRAGHEQSGGHDQILPFYTGEKGPNGSHCYECHVSGPIAIHSNHLAAHFPPEETNESVLDTINRAMKSDASISPEAPRMGKIMIGDVGPTEKEKSEYLSEDFVSKCFDKSTPGSSESIQKVKSAMKCATCHNQSGNARGAMYSAPFSNPDLAREFVRRGYMPHPQGSKFSAAEREALDNCLMEVLDQRQNRDFKSVRCFELPSFNSAVQPHLPPSPEMVSDRSIKSPDILLTNPGYLQRSGTSGVAH